MMNKNFLKIFRFVVYTIQLILLYVFEGTPIFNLKFFNVTPSLLIPAFITICIFERKFAAIGFGILTGFLLDLSIGNILGPQILIFGLLGYLIGFIVNYFFQSDILAAVVISVLTIPITLILNFFLKSHFQGFEFNMYSFYNYVLPNILYTFLFTFFIFLINRVIYYFLGNGKKLKSSLTNFA